MAPDGPKRVDTMAESVKKTGELHKKHGQTSIAVSGLTGVVELKKQRIIQLDHEIEADKRGLEEYGPLTIKVHQERQAECRRIIKELEEWCEFFDGAIGPFEKSYRDSQTAVRVKYDEAMGKYKESIDTLIREFGYNPAFKRWHDQL